MTAVTASEHRHPVAVLRRILARMIVFSILELALFVAVPTLVLGWQPVVVTGNSMQPHMRPGDALLISTVSDIGEVEVGSLVTFRRVLDGQLVTHRVVSHNADGQLVTKGDANDGPDSDPVSADRLVGTGRLLVPMVALPAGQPKQFAPVLAVAAVLSLLGLVRSRGRGRLPAPATPSAPAPSPVPVAAVAPRPPRARESSPVAIPDRWFAHAPGRRWPWATTGFVVIVATTTAAVSPPTMVLANYVETTTNTGSQWQANVIENPTGLTLTFNNPTACLGATMSLSWTTSSDPHATTQQIHRKVGNGARTLRATVGPGVQSHVDTGVNCLTTYVYDVVTVASFGVTTWTSAIVAGQNQQVIVTGTGL